MLIAGPCAIEGEEMAFVIAEKCIEIAKKHNIQYVFKGSFKKANRSKIDSFTGIGDLKALNILSKIRNDLKIPVTTDVHEVSDIDVAKEHVDIIQIPAFLCRQTDLLVAAAQTGKVVNVKKGQFLSPYKVENIINKLEESGNKNILITERGNTFGFDSLVTDLKSIPIMQAFGYPVIFDATHSAQIPGNHESKTGGNRQFIPTQTFAAVSSGADGIFMEVHDDVDNALSDASTQWPIDKLEKIENTETKTEAAYVVSSLTGNIVPEKDPNFVTFGDYSSVKSIIASKKFYPIFITGLSGNGKTLGVTQACAEKKREMIRVNITIETDEDDLIGGFRLIDGNTVWHNGPVIEALERGAILLLDEIDLASNKILCLQSVLEGKGVFLKKLGRYVKPANGFNVFATANTKGKGSEDGRFIGTNVLNEAFLERFALTFEQEYPTPKTEQKILEKVAASIGKNDTEFYQNLANWADIIRRTFKDGGIDEVISTRRLVHIVNAYRMFGDKLKSITMCISRFDEETRNAVLDLYTKVDEGVDLNEDENSLEESNDSEYNEYDE